MQALETASAGQNIEPFARFIALLAGERLKGKNVAELPK